MEFMKEEDCDDDVDDEVEGGSGEPRVMVQVEAKVSLTCLSDWLIDYRTLQHQAGLHPDQLHMAPFNVT